MEFRILGPLEVVEDGRPVPLDRRRMRALLAFLLLHANELVSADRLIDEVWGPEPPKTAGASLQNYVSRLRKAIGADAVVSQPPGYVLRIDPERFDLARFERLTSEARGAETRERAGKLRAALALWRGPALDDLAFEPFARDEVGRLEEARLAALEDCIDAELELGRGGDLVGELEELVEQHPLRERFRAQLMRALYRAGRQADALAAFQAARDVLTEELGLEPGEELRALQQAILRQDPALGPSAEVAADERGPDRRTVTVLFCDLVGSSELAAQLDPEAYRALLSRYFEFVREPIERHGGTIEKFIGDAVLAIFGVPELHEDDALRAVRAGVEAQVALREAEIDARVGISTGEVHVLSAPGEPLHVSGAPASAASQLEGRAPTGGVLLNAATYALVRDAVRAAERDGASWLVHEVVPGAPAYARRLDAPLVGRAQELDRLRGAFADARDKGRARVVTVVGEAGIGKTRLMRELVHPLRNEARILVGRCASYGEGATYLPIAEALRQVAPSLEELTAALAAEDDGEQVAVRIAELIGLQETPAAAVEAFWAVRRFLESLARERPLVLVLDDIHWAEPTLLDLIEYLGEWTEGPVLVLCAARRELVEDRHTWGGPTSTGFLVELSPLAPDEMTRLVLNLADVPLEHDVKRSIVEQAGGNPLFAEQLLALGMEAPAALERTPPSVEALLASRLDHLEPQELTVLRRASVIGRRFTREELGALTPREETARTERTLQDLTQRALLHPRDHVFAFHHALVRDIAYRGIPKTQRADLHELAASALDRRNGPDEITGYHYEQAFRALTEIGYDDDRTYELATAAGERLARAGIRAWKRADVSAAVALLGRAHDVAPRADASACELALALHVAGEIPRALELLDNIVGQAEAPVAMRASLERAYIQSLVHSDSAADVLDVATAAMPVLRKAGDERGLGRAWIAVAHVRGGFYCEYQPMADAALEAMRSYRRAGWSTSMSIVMLASALYWGPKPVAEAIPELEAILASDSDRATRANTLLWLAGLESMRANFDVARAQVEEARSILRDLGLSAGAVDSGGRLLGLIELRAGDPQAAEAELRACCLLLQRRQESAVLATRAAELADALFAGERYDDAAHWIALARDAAGEDDLDAALTRFPVEARLLARADHARGEELIRHALEEVSRTDSPIRQAEIRVALADILGTADAEVEAQLAAALHLYERKGSLPDADRVRNKTKSPVRGSSFDTSTL